LKKERSATSMGINLISNVFSDAFWDASGAGQFHWGIILVFAIGGILILANILRRKIRFLRRALMPTAVIAGLGLLVVKEIIFHTTNVQGIEVGGYVFQGIRVCPYTGESYRYEIPRTFGHVFQSVFSSIIYHALPIAFIALGLRDKKDYSESMTKEKKKMTRAATMKSGSVMVSSYLVQGLVGILVTVSLFAIIPELLPGAGLFLPLAFGQGGPQSYAMGGIWNSGPAGEYFNWQNFGLTLAAFGFIASSIPGVVMVNRIAKKKGITRRGNEYPKAGDMPMQQFEAADEVPLAEGIDKFTLQVCMVMGVYLLSIGLIFILDVLFRLTGVQFLIGLTPTLWGFAFMIAMLVALATKAVLRKLRKEKIMKRQYPNTYMMNRIAGFAFDISIVCALVMISVMELGIMWIPIIIMAVLGALATGLWLKFITKRVFPAYKDEAFLAMYGTMTGTISCGTILTREIDPHLKTPVSEDLVMGSAGAVPLAFPLIIFVQMAASGLHFIWIFAVVAVYLALLTCYMLNVHKKIFRRRAVAVVSGVGGETSEETLNDRTEENNTVSDTTEEAVSGETNTVE